MDFRDALASLAARMPRAVKEHEIMRIAATLEGANFAEAAQSVRTEVMRWVQKRAGGALPKDAWELQDFEYLSGGRNSSGIRLRAEGSDVWAVRADDPDKTVPGRVWTNEIVVGFSSEQPPRISVRQLVSSPEASLSVEPHSPGFMQQLVAAQKLHNGEIWLRDRAERVRTSVAADYLVDVLCDSQRQLPVIVITLPDGCEAPEHGTVDADALARAVLGLAIVVVLPAEFTWALTERFGRHRSVFGGAIRTYFPNFDEDAPLFEHRLFLANQIDTELGARSCIQWIRLAVATESIKRNAVGRNILTFSAIRSARLANRQSLLEKIGAKESEKLAAAKDHIIALEKQIEDVNDQINYFAGEHDKAEERAKIAEEQLRASTFRIQQLLGQIRERGDAADTNIVLPTEWDQFANWCDTNLAGRVVLTSSARRGVRDPNYEDVQQVARCLLWLANECRDRRILGGIVEDAPIEDGIRNSHCGGDEYGFLFHGKRIAASWHVKSGGNSHDPRRCLRIYYGWDESTQQIIIADMPGHKRTGAS